MEWIPRGGQIFNLPCAPLRLGMNQRWTSNCSNLKAFWTSNPPNSILRALLTQTSIFWIRTSSKTESKLREYWVPQFHSQNRTLNLLYYSPNFWTKTRTRSDLFKTLAPLLQLCFGKFLQVIRYVFLAKKLKNSQKRLLCVIRHKNRVCQSWWKVTLWWPPISERTINVLSQFDQRDSYTKLLHQS